MAPAQKEALVESMALMDEQPFSRVFRPSQPTFNGLIWAYHWLQVGLYEPMVAAGSRGEGRRHPRAAVIFDNLHLMHDLISDVLASPTIPRDRKREVIYDQLEEFRSPAGKVISMDGWRRMADHMGGIAAMGGPAVGLLRPPSETRPASDSTGKPSETDAHHNH